MRFEHSVSVSFTCTALAMRYGYDIQKAELAGLMHDCAKRFTDSELICKCQKHGVALTEAEIKAPAVIHAKYGAYLAENKYGIQDPEIISAIACHKMCIRDSMRSASARAMSRLTRTAFLTGSRHSLSLIHI